MFDQRDVFGIHTSRTRPKHAKPHLPSCPRPRFTKHVSAPLLQVRYSTRKSQGRVACTHQHTTWPQTQSRYREGMSDGSYERDDTPFAFPLSRQSTAFHCTGGVHLLVHITNTIALTLFTKNTFTARRPRTTPLAHGNEKLVDSCAISTARSILSLTIVGTGSNPDRGEMQF